jgi:poly(3-hydroxybutyrate) depolymerase
MYKNIPIMQINKYKTPADLSFVNRIFFILLMFLSIISTANAQDANAMYYKKEYYNTSYTRLITYSVAKDFRGNNQTLQADVYYPGTANDNGSNVKRPAIILYHGGGFFPPGGRNSAINKQLADYYNRRGFTVITATYRLGWNYKGKGQSDILAACFSTKEEDYKDAMYRAFQDSRNLVKYLKTNANDLKIDENSIFVLGYSAGAILALTHLGDDASMFNNDRKNRLGTMPTDDASTQVAGIISIAGAHTMDNTNYRNIPTAFFHGSCDFAVPYGREGKMIACPNFPKTYGPDVITENLKKQNIYYELHTLCNYDHDFMSKNEPTNVKISKGMAYVLDASTDFLNNVINGNASKSVEVTVTSLPEFPHTAKSTCPKTSGFRACNGSQAPILVTNNNNKSIPSLRKNLFPNLSSTTISTTNTEEYPEFLFKIDIPEKSITIYEDIEIFVSTPKSKSLYIEMFNITGTKIADVNFSILAGESTINLKGGNLQEGTYLITISDENGVQYTDYLALKKSFF